MIRPIGEERAALKSLCWLRFTAGVDEKLGPGPRAEDRRTAPTGCAPDTHRIRAVEVPEKSPRAAVGLAMTRPSNAVFQIAFPFSILYHVHVPNSLYGRARRKCATLRSCRVDSSATGLLQTHQSAETDVPNPCIIKWLLLAAHRLGLVLLRATQEHVRRD